MELTASQKQAIESKNSKILVSAGAGSGKTAVLASRVVSLVEQGIPVSNIVVVTFTRAAASEMKLRIKNKLQESSVLFARAQADKVETAPISTLHAYASALLKQYFFYLGIDPAFSVLDEATSSVLKNQSLEAVFTRLTEEKNDQFFDLVDVFFQNRKDDAFKSMVFSISDFLNSLDQPENFKQTAVSVYNNVTEDSRVVSFLKSEIASRANFFLERLNQLLTTCKSTSGAEKLSAVLYELELHLSRLQSATTLSQIKIAASGYEAPAKVMRAGVEELAEEVASFKLQVKKFFETLKELVCVDKEPSAQSEDNLVCARRIVALLGVVDAYQAEYAAEKDALGALDFSDLEKRLNELLVIPQAQQEIAAQIDALFVDEFQDTNRLQAQIYKKLTSRGVFYVGDVKQSIYGFRLAEPKIFLETREQFRASGGEVITLDQNFRSHQDLIGFTNLLFSKIMTLNFGGEDYEKEAAMKKGGEPFPKPASSGLVSFYSENNFSRVKIYAIKKAKNSVKNTEKIGIYSVKNHENSQNEKVSSAIAEGKVLAKVLKELAGKKIFDARLGRERDVESRDIAVLSSTRGEYLKTLLKTAEAEGYSFAPDIQQDIARDPDIAELLNLLKLVQNPKQDIPLFIALAGFFGGLGSEELAQIKLKYGQNCTYFFDAIEEFKNAKNLPKTLEEAHKKVLNLYALLDDLRFYSSYLQVSELIEKINEKTDFVRYIVSRKEERGLLYENLIDMLVGTPLNRDLDEFLEGAKSTGFMAGEQLSPSRGIAMLDENNNPVTTFQNVLVTTIHKSKGLEFPIVILVGAGRPFNRDELTQDFMLSRSLGLGISSFDALERTKSNNIVKNAIKLDLQKQALEEDIRLLYVAVTRAINHLVIIGVGDPTEKETITKNIVSSGCFFDLISKVYSMRFPPLYIQVVKDSFEMLSSQKLLTVPSKVLNLPIDAEMVKRYKESFNFKYPHLAETELSQKYSVTELSQVQQVVEMRPLASESSTNIGNAYHHLMQHINFSATTKELLDGEKARLLSEELITQEELDLIDDEKILKCLNSPLFTVLSTGKRKVLREQEFLMSVPACEVGLNPNVQDQVLVQGVFDLVVFDKDSVLIIDYKTSGAKEMQDLVIKHGRQMELYAMAASKAFNLPVKVGIWSFSLGTLVRVL